MNVLVADDDQTSRQVLNAILIGEHYTVTEVDNGIGRAWKPCNLQPRPSWP